MGPAPLGGSSERGKLPAPWEVPSPSRDISQDRASEPWKRTQEPACSRKNAERPAQMVSATALLSPVHLPGKAWAGCRSLGFGDQTWGEDWDGLHGNSLKGQPHLRVYAEEAWATLEARSHCAVACKGRGRTHHYTLFPCMCSQVAGHCLQELQEQSQAATASAPFQERL